MTNNPTNSKEGRVPEVDPAPGLPAKGGRIFGESPIAGRPSSENPTNSTSGRVADKDLAAHSTE